LSSLQRLFEQPESASPRGSMKASKSIANTAQTDAPANLLIEKGVITEAEFSAKIAEERATSREN